MSDTALTTLRATGLYAYSHGRLVAQFGWLRVFPGLFLACAIALIAYAVRSLPGVDMLSPLIIAIVLGMAFHNTVGTPARAKSGVAFSMRRVLRAAIVLLGLQLTTQQILEVGGVGVAIIVATLAASFVATKTVGRLLGVEPKLAELIAAGTSVCGASAVIATNTVTDGKDEDVAYAVACVTLFGTISMVLYPALGAALRLDPHAYGLWAGASIHEVAQVVGAAFQHGQEAGEFGTISKLSRVMLLAPLVFMLGWTATRRGGAAADPAQARKGPQTPWFVLGFIALIGLNSLGAISPGVKQALVPATIFMLTVSLAALGLETDIRKLRAKGLRPLLLGAVASLFISAFSLALIMLAA